MRVYNIKTGKDIEVGSGDNVVGGALFGNIALYVDGTSFGDLYLYNLNTKKKKLITNNVSNPKIWGDKIVWTYNCGGGNYGIKGYNISRQKLFDISPVNDCNQGAPDIYNDTVVWVDFTNRKYKIYEKNLNSGKVSLVFDSPSSGLGVPVISQKYISWIDDRGNNAHDVVVKNRKTGQVVELTNNGPQQSSPSLDIDNDVVVWMSWNTGNGDIYGAYLKH
jgi:beta propeller repeat protein